ncbi:aldehyde dehydrogenase family-domain-containing protein [Fusarium avenaceum]|nr:aldehyde dehydrogenase family-domain-containing protein [Fusarium avenaceum]
MSPSEQAHGGFDKAISSMDTVPFIINGEDVTSTSTFPVTNPFDAKKLWDGSAASVSDALGAVEAAQAAFASWSQTKPSFRRDILFRAADLFISRKEELFRYQSEETGAGRQFMEINLNATVQILKDIGGRIEAAVEGSVPTTVEEGSHAIIVKEPYGVVLAIAPWNAPYVLGVRSVAFALATGNTTVLKGSELSPRVFWALGDVFRQAGLPDGCLNVIYHRTADAAAVTESLIAHRAIKKINFTGSTIVGSIIASLAGKHVKPLLLELGGKASAIVLKDADLEKAATACVLGAFIHSGQVCMSTERIVVHKSIAEEFDVALKEAAEKLFGSANPPFVLVNSAAVQKNKSLIANAVSKGATTLVGNAEAVEDQPTKMRPVIISNVSKDMDIYHTESFGPTVSVITFETEEEALGIANDTDYGLSGAVFSEDLRAALRVARKYESGAVHINSMTVHDEASLVHGGAKKSGYGRFNAAQGLGEFLSTSYPVRFSPSTVQPAKLKCQSPKKVFQDNGSEKPYNCLYCSLTSSRKDVIVRHTKNFHHGLANRKASGFRGRRRTNSHPGASGPRVRKNKPSRASPASTTARGDCDRHSEGVDDAIQENEESPTSNDMDGSQSSRANSLDEAMPSHSDMFSAYLPGNPLAFNPSFMDPELVNPNLSEMFDLDALLAQGFLSEIPGGNPPELPISVLHPPKPSVPTSASVDRNSAEHSLVADDNTCENAWFNLAKYPAHILASLRFPSKYAVKRFVKAFFEHFAAHIPIIHEPTFNIATTASPLLLAIMACGAVYLGEASTSISMHGIAVQLVFEHERMGSFNKVDPETLTWMLQTYLLLGYLEINCGSEAKSAHAFPHCINLTREAIKELQIYSVTSYKSWIRQESISRCIATTILIGASLCSRKQEAWLASPIVEARFPLPSDTVDWQKPESSFAIPTQTLYSDEALEAIVAGRKPSQPMSEFGLVTVASALLYRICSFELLTSSQHGEIYATYTKKMGLSLDVLDGIIKTRMGEQDTGLAPDSTVHCAKSLLDSAFYHLYASIPLSVMKKLLWSPVTPRDADILRLSSEARSPDLYKAFICAAEKLRYDCRLGLSYLRKMAPIKFGPEDAVGAYEGGLLLCWYLHFAQNRLPQIGSRSTLNALLTDSFAEIADLQSEFQDRLWTLPLAVSVELLSDDSVWKWPSSVAERIKLLMNKFEESDTTIQVATVYAS